jgi:hypothetical protein
MNNESFTLHTWCIRMSHHIIIKFVLPPIH